MSKVSISGDQNGTANFTIKAPNSNTDRTLTLPDEVGKFLTDSGALNVDSSAPTQSATIDSNGNLLVGTTVFNPGSSPNVVGVSIRQESFSQFSSESTALLLNRKGTDGNIVQFRKDGSSVGSISSRGGGIIIGGEGQTRLSFFGNDFRPVNSDGSNDDNSKDVGDNTSRFDDVYATNGNIATSDINEKQDVEELSEAEARVAAKAKTLLRKYRWKSAVEEKGEEARIHFGIIAQDLEQAFIDEGLDAGRYGMFIRGEWYEAEVEKTRTVENDDGTETTETYMATETYDTAEEAPADAVHKERLGVRYHELLAFIIAAI